MALSNAEKQRNYRARQREKREEELRATAMIPVAEHEVFRDRVRRLAEQQRAQIAGLEDQVAELEDQLDGKSVPPCTACGGQLACPACYQGGQYD